MEEFKRPDRRFVAVVCKSVERIPRITYLGTKIEYDLEPAGVGMLAADEGIDRAVIRRVKQAVAEFFVLQVLELSWGGFETHTEQGGESV